MSSDNCPDCGFHPGNGHAFGCSRYVRDDVLLETTAPIETLLPKLPDGNPKTRYGVLKTPLHLVPPVAIQAEAEAFRQGAEKYGPYNWRDKGVTGSVYVAAALRHIQAYQDGEQNDVESGKPHLGHARACLAIILDADAAGKLKDDRPPPLKNND